VLGVDRVVAFTEMDNLRSRAVMERLGTTYAHECSPGLIPGSEGMHDGALFVLYENMNYGETEQTVSWTSTSRRPAWRARLLSPSR
jgi:hypothetical protein